MFLFTIYKSVVDFDPVGADDDTLWGGQTELGQSLRRKSGQYAILIGRNFWIGSGVLEILDVKVSQVEFEIFFAVRPAPEENFRVTDLDFEFEPLLVIEFLIFQSLQFTEGVLSSFQTFFF